MTRQTHVIIGGGLAAAEAAKTLRAEGFDGRVVLVAAESRLPYERPPLTKDYLRGETASDKLLAQPEAWYGDQDVDLLLGRRAVRLDPSARRVRLDDGEEIRFNRLLLATGASPRPLRDGEALPDWVTLLRTIEDADRLRSRAVTSRSAVVAGGGWIAAESAASLRQLGLDVTLAVPGREILERSLGVDVGGRYSDLHREKGVRILSGARVVDLVDDATGHGVRLSTGEVVRADLVVLGLGARPNDELARSSGIATADGILVDGRLETTAPGIFAAGDVASAWHPRYGERVRSEHWDNARRQGRTAARNMVGGTEVYDRVPYFYSDQFDRGMELLGRPQVADRVAIRDEDGDDAFIALWLRGGRIVAGMHANVWDAKKPLDRLVSAGTNVDLARFRAGLPLDELNAVAA